MAPMMTTLKHQFNTYSRIALELPHWVRAIGAVAYAALLTLVLLQSSSQPVVGPVAPKEFNLAWEILLTTGHIVGFSLLVVTIWWGLCPPAPLPWTLIAAVLFACVLGLTTEVLQSIVPDRSASLFDLGVNWSAALLTAYRIYRHHR
ncbi:MAG: VanZ family protein [Anaerolineae bacterium]|nr:VanZ family protein [Anaerolineae bacterium]